MKRPRTTVINGHKSTIPTIKCISAMGIHMLFGFSHGRLHRGNYGGFMGIVDKTGELRWLPKKKKIRNKREGATLQALASGRVKRDKKRYRYWNENYPSVYYVHYIPNSVILYRFQLRRRGNAKFCKIYPDLWKPEAMYLMAGKIHEAYVDLDRVEVVL